MIEEDRIFDSDVKKRLLKMGFIYFYFFEVGFICDWG